MKEISFEKFEIDIVIYLVTVQNNVAGVEWEHQCFSQNITLTEN